MTADEFDRSVARWLENEGQEAGPPPAAASQAIAGTRRRHPRPSWFATAGSRWVDADAGGGILGRPIATAPAWWIVAVVLMIAAIVGGAILAGGHRTVAPEGFAPGHLAYGFNGSIYVADWDGANPVRIAAGLSAPGGTGPATCGSYWGEGRIWSPDGRHLAYRSAWDSSCEASTGPGKVFLADPDGRVVASFPGQGWNITWSPDSSSVATWNDGGDPANLGHKVGVYGLDGRLETVLTVPPNCPLPGDFDPRWSPDGRSVVVWPCEIPIDGRAPKGLPTTDPRSYNDWAYSPDGRRVVYGTGQLFVATTDGSSPNVLAANGADPQWSPTSDRVAFVSQATSGDQLDLVDVVTGQVTVLARSDGSGHVELRRFSPTGDRILFSRSDANSVGTGLWSIRSDASDLRALVSGTNWGDWQPEAAPQGQ
jgi:Tol biopolymer transport system component